MTKTDFGICIGLEGGIDGLVHLSDISWNEPGETAVRRYSKGEFLETVILSVDPERERISLGVKQLDQDPFTDYTAENNRGAIVKGIIKEVEPKEAIIELTADVSGVLKASEISIDRVEDARNALTVNEEIEVKIISIDRKNRTILSVRDQNTFDEPLRKKRLMTLIHLFQVHRYKIDSVHYVSPTEDNQYQTAKMKTHGIFVEVHPEVGDIIVADCDPERIEQLLDPDADALQALIEKKG